MKIAKYLNSRRLCAYEQMNEPKNKTRKKSKKQKNFITFRSILSYPVPSVVSPQPSTHQFRVRIVWLAASQWDENIIVVIDKHAFTSSFVFFLLLQQKQAKDLENTSTTHRFLHLSPSYSYTHTHTYASYTLNARLIKKRTLLDYHGHTLRSEHWTSF